MKSEVAEIRLNSGEVGRIWESRPESFSFAHPNGSQGSGYKTFEEAETALNEADGITID